MEYSTVHETRFSVFAPYFQQVLTHWEQFSAIGDSQKLEKSRFLNVVSYCIMKRVF